MTPTPTLTLTLRGRRGARGDVQLQFHQRSAELRELIFAAGNPNPDPDPDPNPNPKL